MNVRVKQALAVVASLIVAGVMLVLGVWQMASYEASTRDVSAERAAEPAVALTDAVAADGTVADIYGRPVFAEGSYLTDGVLIGSAPPLRVVTPFELSDGRCVAVVRGAVDSPSEVSPPSAEPTQVSGIFLAADLPSDEAPAEGAALASLRLQALAQQWSCPLIGGYLTVSAEEASAAGMQPAELVLPETEGSATHRGYALQWWVFAAAAVAIGIYSARQIGRAAK